MTVDLVRLGWPNTAAIFALAIMPLISLAIPADLQQATLAVEGIESSTQSAMLAIPPPGAEQ